MRIVFAMKRIGVALILILTFFGLANSSYLAQHEASGEPLICNIQNLSGCNIVTASQYSKLFGIPLAEYGVFFYGLFFIIAALELIIFERLLRRVLQAISIVGIVFSLYFTFVQVYFIGAFCIYCLTSAVIAFIIFLCASFIEPIRNGTKKNSPNGPVHPPMPFRHLQMPPAP
jgi:uncharacterized membrane protein